MEFPLDNPHPPPRMTPVSGPETNSILRRVIILAGIILMIGLGVSTVFRSGPHTFGAHQWGSKFHRTDFTVYQVAGRAVLEGQNIYEVANPRGWYFMYLPVVAVVMAPFALLNVFWASLLWYLLSVAMLVHMTRVSVRLARSCFPASELPDFWIGTLALLGILSPAMSGLARGQASMLISYLVILSAWFFKQRREWSAGFCLAGGIVLKVFPGLLLLYFLFKRRWRMAVATTVWLVVLIGLAPSAVFGIKGNAALLNQWMTTIALPAAHPDQAAGNARYAQMIDPRINRNQSVQAVMIRWFAGRDDRTAQPAREPLARRIALAINLCLFFVSLRAIWGQRPPENRMLLEICVVVLLMLFLAPVTWSHNCTVLVMPLAAGLALAPRHRWIGPCLGAYLAGCLLALSMPLLNALGALLLGMIVLWGALVWLLAGNGTGPDSCLQTAA